MTPWAPQLHALQLPPACQRGLRRDNVGATASIAWYLRGP